jgi:uncharacterized membrane-anchored protein YjiN (DUF445 family)
MTQAASRYPLQYDSPDSRPSTRRADASPGDGSMQRDPELVPVRASRVWWMATGLLGLMAILFAVSTIMLASARWMGIVRAFSEAALVGALADWFAVTALFRRPLGLPIPHTGIVPRNKSRIGRSLGIFVQRNFLTEKVLDEQVVNISGSFARLLQNPASRQRVIDRVRVLVPQVLEVLRDGEIQRFLNSQIEDMIRDTDLARAAARVLRALTANQTHEALLDEFLGQLQRFFRSNQLWFRQQLREASPWFVPEMVDRKIFDAITRKTEQTLDEALSNRDHEFRQRMLDSVYGFIVKLESSPELRQRAESLKTMLLSSGAFREYVESIRNAILAAIDADVERRESVLVGALERVLQNLVDSLAASPKLQRKVNGFIRNILSTLVGQESTYVADLIAKTIDGWDSKTLVSKLEEQVGADLQYIRINGTLVGGLVGLALYWLGFWIKLM